MSRSIVVFGLGLMCSFALADDSDSTPRQQRLAGMRMRAEALRLKAGDKPELRVRAEPLLRYNDPSRTTTDGTLWLWERTGRPVAAICMFNDSREGFQWNFEMVSMSDDPMIVDGRPGWNWTPMARKHPWIRIDEPIPANTEPARLLQMKAVLDRFRAEEINDGDKSQLRLLPRRVHRYQASADNIEDGAIFLFASGTNPEILVQIESVLAADRHWQVGFARMSASSLSVFRDDKIVWEADRIRNWDPRHEYYSHYGPDEEAGKRPSD